VIAVLANEAQKNSGGAFKSRAGGIKTIVQHQAPCALKPELFLILKRTYRSGHSEMMMQGGYAHAGKLCEFFHEQRLGVVRRDPCNRFCRPVALISECCYCAQAGSLRSPQNPEIVSPIHHRESHTAGPDGACLASRSERDYPC